MWGKYTAKYMARKSIVAYCRPVGLHERTSDNIAVACKFDKTTLDEITPEEAEIYKHFKDVRMENFQCSTPGFNDHAKAIAQIWGELEASTKHFGNEMLTEDLWATSLRLASQVKPTPDHIQGIDEYIREETQHRMLAIIDRDPARRASMEEKGYVWRLWNNFGGETSVYKEREDISIQEVLEYRKGMAE